MARVVVPVAVVAAVLSGAAVLSQGSEQVEATADRAASPIVPVDPEMAAERRLRVSRSLAGQRGPVTVRSAARVQASGVVEEIKPKAVDSKFLTTALNVWTGPGERFTFLTVLPSASKVSITGNTNGPWAEVVRSGKSRWVRRAYLSEEKPKPKRVPASTSGSKSAPESSSASSTGTEKRSSSTSSATGGGTSTGGGLSTAPCATGSEVESGLTPDAVRVHRAVCAAFPQITTYGGMRSDGEHGQGRALDIMVTGSTGTAIAEFVRANSAALGASEVLWSQRIWTVQRSSEGWRPMSDRGSTTANHYDHVHVTVYGSSGG